MRALDACLECRFSPHRKSFHLNVILITLKFLGVYILFGVLPIVASALLLAEDCFPDEKLHLSCNRFELEVCPQLKSIHYF